MSLNEQRKRLENMSWDLSLTEQQRSEARHARKRLSDAQILDAWNRIDERSAEYVSLVDELTAVVDKIQANKLSVVTDELNNVIGKIGGLVSE